MTTQSPDPQHGFQFPGMFEITAMGAADVELDALLLTTLEGIGLVIDRASLRQRHSSKGNYVSVVISFHAPSRAEYDAAHEALRACPQVRWTL